MDPQNPGAKLTQTDLNILRNILQIDATGNFEEELRDAVFVCIDCEAFEHDRYKTTEVGVSILDTRSIRDTPPSPDASAWFAQIRSEHFRIREYGHLVNKTFVKGCPDQFSFGTSTWVQKADASAVLRRLFGFPTGGGKVEPSLPDVPRNIVLVGHGLRNEVPYLRNLDFELTQAPNVVWRFDTDRLGPNRNGVSLGRLCKAVGLNSTALHNASNDAAYTLRAMLLSAILDSTTAGGFPAFLRQAMAPELAERALRKQQNKDTQSSRRFRRVHGRDRPPADPRAVRRQETSNADAQQQS